jgi:hypothetical protein
MQKRPCHPFLLIWAAGMFLALSLCTYSAFAADKPVCFDVPTASRMVVALEEGKSAQENLSRAMDVIDSYEKVITGLQGAMESQDKSIANSDATVKKMQDLLDQQTKNCNDAIEAAKPSVFMEILKAVGYFGAGVLLGVLIM